MSTTPESDTRVHAWAAAHIRSGIPEEDAVVLAAGNEATSNRLGFVDAVRRAAGPAALAAQYDGAARDQIIIAIGRAAQAAARCAIEGERKVRICAGQDPDAERMVKAVAAADNSLAELRHAMTAPPTRQRANRGPQTARRTAAPTRPSEPQRRPGATPQRERVPIRGPLAYWAFRDRIAADIRTRRVQAEPGAMIEHAVTTYQLSRDNAAQWTEQFMSSISRDLSRHRTGAAKAASGWSGIGKWAGVAALRLVGK